MRRMLAILLTAVCFLGCAKCDRKADATERVKGQLLSVCKDSELVQYAEVFAEIEDYRLRETLMAIATVESGNGRSKLAREHGNLFGLKSGNRYAHFEDKDGVHGDVCIRHMAWWYPKTFGNAPLSQVVKTYCGGSQEWVDAVQMNLNKMRSELCQMKV